LNLPQTITENTLTLDVSESTDDLIVRWTGTSSDRDPGKFLAPLFQQVLAAANTRCVVMDFSQLEYMNSSTFTPLVRLLVEARQAEKRLRLEYSKERKWQALSFVALKSFETPDGRITLLAK
jgi:anti-anti-sigma regulatory factor